MSTSPERSPCPYCGELIIANAVKCRYCGADLDDAPEGDGMERASAVLPRTVFVAGVAWIILGCLFLLNALLAMGLSAAGNQESNPAACGPLLGIVMGAAFVFVGMQTVRGTARDTLGNAIGSIVLGILQGAAGGFLLVSSMAQRGKGDPTVLIAIGCFALIICAGLVVAGVLALMGRAEYKAWYKAQNKRNKRRRKPRRPEPMEPADE